MKVVIDGKQYVPLDVVAESKQHKLEAQVVRLRKMLFRRDEKIKRLKRVTTAAEVDRLQARNEFLQARVDELSVALNKLEKRRADPKDILGSLYGQEWARRNEEWRARNESAPVLADTERNWLLSSMATVDAENTAQAAELAYFRRLNKGEE